MSQFFFLRACAVQNMQASPIVRILKELYINFINSEKLVKIKHWEVVSLS